MSRVDKTMAERRSDAAAAKQAMLRKLQERPGPDDPAVIARKAERAAIAAAREERQAAKAEAARQAEIDRLAREEAEKAERALQAERAWADQAAQQAQKEEEAKRARDERYALRAERTPQRVQPRRVVQAHCRFIQLRLRSPAADPLAQFGAVPRH